MKDLEDLEGNDRLAALKKKSVSVNARGRKSIEFSTRTEKLLLVWHVLCHACQAMPVPNGQEASVPHHKFYGSKDHGEL